MQELNVLPLYTNGNTQGIPFGGSTNLVLQPSNVQSSKGGGFVVLQAIEYNLWLYGDPTCNCNYYNFFDYRLVNIHECIPLLAFSLMHV